MIGCVGGGKEKKSNIEGLNVGFGGGGQGIRKSYIEGLDVGFGGGGKARKNNIEGMGDRKSNILISFREM